MGRAKISAEIGRDAVCRAVEQLAPEVAALGSAEATTSSPATTAPTDADRDSLATAVRYLLQLLADTVPGNTVEVRVPPFGAIQCIEGPTHTRGTPPNVVETDAATWLRLATGALSWPEARARGSVSASGQRADLSDFLPIRWR
ncbi:MAG: hypothetical protein H7248_04965 [Microbacteriaceae bacterium]|nr:hypothetical protein [Microbacteriaceae bacterium]